MDYKAIRLSVEQTQGVLPDWVCDLLGRGDVYSFVALEDKRVQGIAVYMHSPTDDHECILEYIYVAEQMRGKGVAKELMRYCEHVFSQKGIRSIAMKCVGDAIHVSKQFDYFTRDKYIPVTFNGHFVVYYLSDLLDSMFAHNLSKMQGILRNVCYINQIPESTMKKFLVDAQIRGYYYDLDAIDPLFARFYVQNNEVIGYMNLEEVEENVLYLVGTYLKETGPAQIVLPAMIASALKIAGKIMPKETLVVLQLYKENGYAGIKTLFGEGHKDFMLQEYVKKI